MTRRLPALGLALVLAACSGLGFKPNFLTDPSSRELPRVVAVLPFEGPEGKAHSLQIVRGTLYNHLSGTTYDVVKLHLVDERLQRAQLTAPEQIAARSTEELGDLLKADALLYGTVTHYDRLYAVVYSNVSVGAKIRLVDARSGKIIWDREDVARIHGGGVPLSPWGAAFTAASTALNLRDVELLHASDDLARKLIRGVPAPPLAEARRAPRVDRVLGDAAGKLLKTGGEVAVIMEGEPGHVAAFDVVPIARNLAMTESPDGVYTGRFTVRPSDNAQDAYVVARLSDSAGRTAEREEILGRFTVDTSAPSQPTGLASTGGNGEVHLEWQPNAEPDLVAYRIYRSLTPLTGFATIATVEESRYRDASVENGVAYYYRVGAVDRAGNESPQSQSAVARAVAPGPTPISGPIAADVTWYARSSPYVIEDDAVVQTEATLTIEPGTEIRSRGGRLVVRGRLVATGEAERRTTFTADAQDRRWGGIVIDAPTSRSELRGCEVRLAAAGITVVSGTVSVTACRIAGNETGVIIGGSGSDVVVQGTTVERNLGDGLVIRDGARVVIEAGVISENGQDGIVVAKASPKILGNRISRNGRDGISVAGGAPVLRRNSIEGNRRAHVSNLALDSSVIDANENFFGSVDPAVLLAAARGRVEVSKILDAPPPEGKPLSLPILESPLRGSLTREGHLVAWRSPYLVQGPVTLERGATLHIQPGVVLHFAPGSTGFLVRDGAIQARGTAEQPVIFTSASRAPAPGDFRFAVEISEGATRSSVFDRVRLEYAATAMRVGGASVEITHSEISRNGHGGVEVSNRGVVKISHSRIHDHRNGAALTVMGFGRLTVRQSAITDNAWAIFNHSGAQVDARENWWGGATPDDALFVGDVDHREWLDKAPEEAVADTGTTG